MSTRNDVLDQGIQRLRIATHLAEIQHLVVHTARGAVAAEGATFVVRDDDQCFYVDEDAASPLWQGQRFPLTACISGWAMLHGETAIVADVERDPRVPYEAYRPKFVRSLVMTPVAPAGGEAIAAIGAYWSAVREATDEEVGSIALLATATMAALERVGLDHAPFLPADWPT
ncbi:MAG TPA: GAF domain-containing protein [Acidimicrobiia bacterium]